MAATSRNALIESLDHHSWIRKTNSTCLSTGNLQNKQTTKTKQEVVLPGVIKDFQTRLLPSRVDLGALQAKTRPPVGKKQQLRDRKKDICGVDADVYLPSVSEAAEVSG